MERYGHPTHCFACFGIRIQGSFAPLNRKRPSQCSTLAYGVKEGALPPSSNTVRVSIIFFVTLHYSTLLTSCQGTTHV